MKNILALIGLVIVGFAGIGWYCGWYKLHLQKAPDGNIQIQTEVDTHKVADDSSAFFQKVGKVIGERGSKDGQPTATLGATPGPTPPSSAPAPAANGDTFHGSWLMGPTKPAPRMP